MTKEEIERQFAKMLLVRVQIGTLDYWTIPKTGVIIKVYPGISSYPTAHTGTVMFDNEGEIYTIKEAMFKIQEIIQKKYF
jgi:hypothetical protein